MQKAIQHPQMQAADHTHSTTKYRLSRWYHHLGFFAIVLGMTFKSLLPVGFMPSPAGDLSTAFTLCQPAALWATNADKAEAGSMDESAADAQSPGWCVYGLLALVALPPPDSAVLHPPQAIQRSLISTLRAEAITQSSVQTPPTRAPPAAA